MESLGSSDSRSARIVPPEFRDEFVKKLNVCRNLARSTSSQHFFEYPRASGFITQVREESEWKRPGEEELIVCGKIPTLRQRGISDCQMKGTRSHILLQRIATRSAKLASNRHRGSIR